MSDLEHSSPKQELPQKLVNGTLTPCSVDDIQQMQADAAASAPDAPQQQPTGPAHAARAAHRR
jgi:hypothetical protein